MSVRQLCSDLQRRVDKLSDVVEDSIRLATLASSNNGQMVSSNAAPGHLGFIPVPPPNNTQSLPMPLFNSFLIAPPPPPPPIIFSSHYTDNVHAKPIRNVSAHVHLLEPIGSTHTTSAVSASSSLSSLVRPTTCKPAMNPVRAMDSYAAKSTASAVGVTATKTSSVPSTLYVFLYTYYVFLDFYVSLYLSVSLNSPI